MRQIVIAADRALSRLYAVCGAIAAFAVVLIAILVAASILSRLFGVYVGGLTEGAGYAMAAAGSFGLAFTFGAGGHIRVDLLISRLSESPRGITEFVALSLTAAATCYLAWFMVRMVRISWKFGDLSDGSDGLPIWLPQFPAALGITIFAIALLHHLSRFCLTGQMPWASSGDILSDEKGA